MDAVPVEGVVSEAVRGDTVQSEAALEPAALAPEALAPEAQAPAAGSEGYPPDETQPVGADRSDESPPEPEPAWDLVDLSSTVPAASGMAAAAPRNEVVLVGRVAAPAEERELPSGDVLATFRLVVDRPVETRPGTGRRVTVDTFDCAAWGTGVRRRARSLAAGDVVEVHGALRRRFWRAGASASSRCEVEVGALQRLSRAPAPPTPRTKRGAAVVSEAATSE